ncbi:DUF732 domain-containing protein [Mycobacterium frederiksbergense]|jgi:pyruvoyl-dependent arginine decarboxylase (PvlArgDC)|uniref:DUF732 domain-containing protein n=2 Tax=Mycobacteriaceae TaxID=1762 RepID=A0A6H0SAP6_9MYCO|nr:DUF732 domain-containing protein [Mycolicibacterium frederiksbergense]MCV7048250.1 DUF732 domain-containing protein [Mycolicibacterium frederiksbergense]QIV84593.1 DUF732 domain-containing protein [Mycolicibacterium frederiksbergense]
MTTMRKMLLPVLAATFAAGLAVAAPASADETGYFTELTDYGYGDTSQEVALNLGYSVCEDLANGVPQQVTLDAIYENTNENVDAADATFLYKAAILHLC